MGAGKRLLIAISQARRVGGRAPRHRRVSRGLSVIKGGTADGDLPLTRATAPHTRTRVPSHPKRDGLAQKKKRQVSKNKTRDYNKLVISSFPSVPLTRAPPPSQVLYRTVSYIPCTRRVPKKKKKAVLYRTALQPDPPPHRRDWGGRGVRRGEM